VFDKCTFDKYLLFLDLKLAIFVLVENNLLVVFKLQKILKLHS